ncbi:glycosyltransferase family 4 protein [Synechocystis sp. CACIAM 05]|uniref:glycosyltransferase family 4 protein n=1 Tax=Synechocystis sp. CACIAM 05 TaxID=1933929 RepID=UPI001390AFBC|nr:glycosyltransferase family 4 protein [Synechocystis sp. CACIAM 05]
MKVTISNGSGRFHLYHAGAAASKSGYLKSFITGIYIRQTWYINLLLKLSYIDFFSNKIKKLSLRKDDEIESSQIVSLAFPEVIRTVISRFDNLLPGSGILARHLAFLSFGYLTTFFLEESEIFHVRSGFGHSAINKAKHKKMLCLVDHSIAHPKVLNEIIHNEPTKWGESVTSKSWLYPLYWKLVEEDINNSDYLLVNSDFVKETIIKNSQITQDKIFVIPMGIDIEKFSPKTENKKSSKFRAIFVGTIGFRKGVLYLLSTWKKLNLQNAELVLVGAIERDIKPLLSQFDGLFCHVPHVPFSQIVEFYHSSDVFVFPSLAEGSALVVYEAMACGLPIITTPNSGSIVRDTIDGFIVPARDEDAFAEKILWCYQNQVEASKMGDCGASYVRENYTWEKYQERVLDLYHTLIKNQ